MGVRRGPYLWALSGASSEELPTTVTDSQGLPGFDILRGHADPSSGLLAAEGSLSGGSKSLLGSSAPVLGTMRELRGSRLLRGQAANLMAGLWGRGCHSPPAAGWPRGTCLCHSHSLPHPQQQEEWG